MKRFKNYIGQLRLYSLADLVLLLIALQAGTPQFIGAIILHVAFLAYLESSHSHPYRAKVPRWISYALAIIGVVIYGRIEGLIYLFFGFLYTQKIKGLGFVSPLFRGLTKFVYCCWDHWLLFTSNIHYWQFAFPKKFGRRF
jgi:hypothetical protein